MCSRKFPQTLLTEILLALKQKACFKCIQKQPLLTVITFGCEIITPFISILEMEGDIKHNLGYIVTGIQLIQKLETKCDKSRVYHRLYGNSNKFFTNFSLFTKVCTLFVRLGFTALLKICFIYCVFFVAGQVHPKSWLHLSIIPKTSGMAPHPITLHWYQVNQSLL